mmetsp:Transcript_3763/g.7877  ORF Transcript_3763/g.7877 Transcript_3763/m.7877 type:complete len:323 (-) Transcript_3763:349-1317(-)
MHRPKRPRRSFSSRKRRAVRPGTRDAAIASRRRAESGQRLRYPCSSSDPSAPTTAAESSQSSSSVIRRMARMALLTRDVSFPFAASVGGSLSLHGPVGGSLSLLAPVSGSLPLHATVGGRTCGASANARTRRPSALFAYLSSPFRTALRSYRSALRRSRRASFSAGDRSTGSLARPAGRMIAAGASCGGSCGGFGAQPCSSSCAGTGSGSGAGICNGFWSGSGGAGFPDSSGSASCDSSCDISGSGSCGSGGSLVLSRDGIEPPSGPRGDSSASSEGCAGAPSYAVPPSSSDDARDGAADGGSALEKQSGGGSGISRTAERP